MDAMDWTETIDRAFSIAREAAEAGAAAALPYFSSHVETERKSDGSLVTLADKAAEDAIIAIIREAFPDHSILAEETGVHVGRDDARWIIDPLDGTHRFARGMRFWGPMVACELSGEIAAGAVVLPTLRESYVAARGHGAFKDGERIHVSRRSNWKESNIACGSLGRLLPTRHASAALALIEQADYCFSGGDLEGGLLVARGEAEVWIEYGVKPWDVAAIKIIVEEAGGRFTDLEGGADLTKPGFLASNGLLHDEALASLNAPN